MKNKKSIEKDFLLLLDARIERKRRRILDYKEKRRPKAEKVLEGKQK